jgi:hypothetical protein
VLALPAGRSAVALGTPADPYDELTGAPLVGGRLGIFPTRRAGLEAELSLAAPGYRGGRGTAALLVSRLHLATRLLEGDGVDLTLLTGAGIFGLLSTERTSSRDAAGEVHYGAAFSVELRGALRLRLAALHAITTARDAGYAHCAELQLGVVTRLGRRDRRW